ncbi:hypothetical protein NUU61_002900 [Penicillium alfredii]|uniref:Uncharacterized protein n=1 Tax=Penicillium alfredii TaxID=1506179 RepID=A0A9W9KHD2_9EURO|nr:uncharacterized protein NUU61_002900 [Penicillium alfredii]KAJ5105553.1 hypothetical protein NUU61_002900 [Penicillium alfredii]
MHDLFLPVLQEIRDLVDLQIMISKNRVKSVFLIGGFGQNPFLCRYLRKIVSVITVIALVDGWTAVARDALAKTLAETCSIVPQVSVDSGVARKNYGIIASSPFDLSIHDQAKKVTIIFPGVIPRLKHLDTGGDDIKEAQPIITFWLQQQLKWDHGAAVLQSSSRIPVVRGQDREDYYEVSFQIHATYYSAHCEYSLWFEGKNHGGVKVEYV